jgi:hypothetical protein
MSDADAIWLKNPFPYLETLSSSSIIGQRASFPIEVAAELGATLCMGFMYIKSCNETKGIWKDIFHGMMKSGKPPDDQKSLNWLLKHQGLTYPNRPGYLGTYDTDTGKFKYGETDVYVSLLPHESYRRICDNSTRLTIRNSTIVHCLSTKSGYGKHRSQKKFGVW